MMRLPKMNPTLFWQIIGRDLLRNKLRTLLSILGIALGVAILLAVNLANQTAVSQFESSLDRIAGKTNLIISPTSAPDFDERIMKQLTWIWAEGAKMTPVIEQPAVIPAAKGNDALETVQILGVDLLADEAFRAYDWQMSQSAGRVTDDRLALFNRDQVLVGEAFANRHQLKTGDRFLALANDQRLLLQVAGILGSGGVGGAYGGDVLIMDIGPAQEAFGLFDRQHHGHINRVDLIVPEAKLNSLLAQLERILPSGLEASRPTQRSATVSKMLRAYQYNLTILSFIALLVGVFLIYNTMAITIIRRRQEIGSLRAIGVGKSDMMMLFLQEALLFGVIGSALGLILGVVMAQGAIQAVATTIENLYTIQSGATSTHISLLPGEFLKAFAFGIVGTLIGALAPVIEATSVSPIEATRRGSYEIRIQALSPFLGFIGGGFWLVALWAAFQPPIDDLPLFGFLSAFSIIVGAAFWIPVLLNWTLQKLAVWMRRFFKEEGQLAALTLKGALGRTAIAISALMIGIAMMVSLAVMIGSFRETVITWVNQTLKADLWVEAAGRAGRQINLKLDAAAVDRLRYLPGIRAVDTYYEFPIRFTNKFGNVEPARIGVGDLEVLASHGNLSFLNGKKAEDVLQKVSNHLETEPGVVVSESFAYRNGLNEGDTFTLDTPEGPVPFSVDGIYYDYTSDLGYIIIPRQLYSLYFNDDSVSNLAIYLEPHADPQKIRQAMFQAIGTNSALRIRTTGELRKEVLQIFDRTFAITYALHGIAIIIALLSVMNTLFALVLEGKRDFGILKYMGATAGQIRKIILLEAGILGLMGNLTGLIVGLLLSLLLVYVINKQSFGWTIQYTLPWEFLLQSFGLVMITAFLSGLLPARQAGKTPAPEVIRAE